LQKWLEKNGPFDAVVDGANVGLANIAHFSFSQVSVKLLTLLAHYDSSYLMILSPWL
jgi:hypothetical protein